MISLIVKSSRQLKHYHRVHVMQILLHQLHSLIIEHTEKALTFYFTAKAHLREIKLME